MRANVAGEHGRAGQILFRDQTDAGHSACDLERLRRSDGTGEWDRQLRDGERPGDGDGGELEHYRAVQHGGPLHHVRVPGWGEPDVAGGCSHHHQQPGPGTGCWWWWEHPPAT